LLVTISLWWGVSTQQAMWPLPGLYFIEMVALSTTSAFLLVRSDPRGLIITSGAVGIFSVFSMVGVFSVVFFYLPVALIFGVIVVVSDVRHKQHVVAHLGAFLIAGATQAVVMFTIIRLLY